MESMKEFFTNYWLISVFASWLMAQIIKIFTGVFRQREFSITAMIFGSGGMPSSHTASVIGLATSIAWTEGFGSLAFAISAVFAIVVMTDAVGVRQEAGKHAMKLNEILKLHWTKGEKPFKELLGHTPWQVFFGVLTGIAVPSLLSLIPMFGVHG